MSNCTKQNPQSPLNHSGHFCNDSLSPKKLDLQQEFEASYVTENRNVLEFSYSYS